MLPIFFFGNPLLKEEDQNLKEPGSSKFREEMINSPVYIHLLFHIDVYIYQPNTRINPGSRN